MLFSTRWVLPVGVLGLLCAAMPAQKLKVYILAGQSNMEGHAKVTTFDYIGEDEATQPLLAQMRDKSGAPRVCDDVWISYLTGARGNNGEGVGKLTAGFGSRRNPKEDGGKIGPEFTFGLRMDQAHNEPVLIIKTAWGGKSLHTDFRSPSAGPYEFHDKQLAKFEKQGKDLDKIRADKVAATGHYYRLMIEHVKHVLSDIKRVYPKYDKRRGYELAGFVWFQGWNDMVDRGTYPQRDQPGGYGQYTECMAHFIQDVRKDLSASDLPFVIGVMGVGGPIGDSTKRAVHVNFRSAMAAPAGMSEFRGNVAAVPTAPYWDTRLDEIAGRMNKVRNMIRMLRTKNKNHANKDGSMSEQQQRDYIDAYRKKIVGEADAAMFARGASNGGYHYLGCAKTMAQIGYAFADALLKMEQSPNAAKIYRMAIAELRKALYDPFDETWDSPQDFRKSLKDPADVAWRKAVARSAVAITLFAQASQVSRCQFERYPKDLATELSRLVVEFVTMLRIVAAHGWQQTQHDPSGACTTALQMLRYSNHCRGDRSLFGLAVGMGAERSAADLLKAAIPDLAKQGQANAARILEQLDLHLGRRLSSAALADIAEDDFAFMLEHGLDEESANNPALTSARKRAKEIVREMLSPLGQNPAASLDAFRAHWDERIKALRKLTKAKKSEDILANGVGETLAAALVLVASGPTPDVLETCHENGDLLRVCAADLRKLMASK